MILLVDCSLDMGEEIGDAEGGTYGYGGRSFQVLARTWVEHMDTKDGTFNCWLGHINESGQVGGLRKGLLYLTAAFETNSSSSCVQYIALSTFQIQHCIFYHSHPCCS